MPTRRTVKANAKKTKPRGRAKPTITPVVLRSVDAAAFVSLKPTQFHKYVRLGLLPQPITLTDDGRAVAWLKTELESWLAERIAKRNADAAA
jgi:predicted DNA-binding transcriptional regulator AlpA